MAIFGAGSSFGYTDEKKNDFFNHDKFYIGWSYTDAKDLYDMVSLLKGGDIIYLKSNQAGSKTIRVKGIGIVTKSFIHSLNEDEGEESKRLYVKIKWIVKKEFKITIPKNEGKLTNFRAAKFYEEFLPYVQNEIIENLFKQ